MPRQLKTKIKLFLGIFKFRGGHERQSGMEAGNFDSQW